MDKMKQLRLVNEWAQCNREIVRILSDPCIPTGLRIDMSLRMLDGTSRMLVRMAEEMAAEMKEAEA